MNESYSVLLQDATFVTDSGSLRGDFVYVLLINSQPQAQVELTVESSTSGSTTALISQAQKALVNALNGWATAAASNT